MDVKVEWIKCTRAKSFDDDAVLEDLSSAALPDVNVQELSNCASVIEAFDLLLIVAAPKSHMQAKQGLGPWSIQCLHIICPAIGHA